MAAPRLPFLYPNLMRAVRSCEPTTYRSIRIQSRKHAAAFHTSRRREQQSYHRRYGPAAEAHLPPSSRSKEEEAAGQPAVSPPEGKDGSKNPQKQNTGPSEQSRPQEAQDEDSGQSTPAEHEVTTDSKDDVSEEPESREEEPETQLEPAVNVNEDKDIFSSPREPLDEKRDVSHHLHDNPLEDVLHMPSPSAFLTPTGPSPSGDKPPHLSPAPYVHHFDTYSLVRDLSKGDFSEGNSITVMKAVRRILQNNIDLAKQSLTSKSDVENESYLFKAACSELQSSLQTSRNSEMQRQRASRTQLQHEIDILSQRLNQELAGLKDDIKGMFNDHKMTTREHQRSIDTSVQELNYKITVSLNSDGKSEIEGLRWILTRRAALAVAASAFMIILFLKYYSVRKSDSAEEKKEKATIKEIKETRVVHDSPDAPAAAVAPGTDVGESLG